ncbi:MAG: response regulator transcription factor [Chloroflexi bacterium]|nr:response regulator transcription factor [Chloroflexota bacterium]
MANILIVAKDRSRATSLQTDLRQAGHRCIVALDHADAAQAAGRVLDLAVADRASFLSDSATGRWLQSAVESRLLPVVLLVPARELERLGGERLADDFVVEPYRKEELLVRVQRLSSGLAGNECVITRGPLVIDDAAHEVSIGKRRVDLTYTEYELLKFLASHPGRVVTRETLLAEVWRNDSLACPRAVDVHIRRLRSKIEDADDVFIETVRSVGYRFKRAIDPGAVAGPARDYDGSARLASAMAFSAASPVSPSAVS